MSDERPRDPAGPASALQGRQPMPARPAARMTEADYVELLSARDRARTATPRLQSALTTAAVVALAATVVALVVFDFSHFRAMDVVHVDDRPGQPAMSTDYKAWGVALFAVLAAAATLAGLHFDVTARTRRLLTTAGAVVMIAVGAGTALLLDPSRRDLSAYYHVGTWGSRASFDRFIYLLDAFGWIVAGCGVAALVLAALQRRRVGAAYPVAGRRR